VAVPTREGRVSSPARCQTQHQTTAEVWNNVQHGEAPAWEFARDQVWDGDYMEFEERDTEREEEKVRGRITLKIRVKEGKI